MCGRFTSQAKREEVEKEFDVKMPNERFFKPRYNIAPTQTIAVVLESGGARIIEGLRWGLIPNWSIDQSFGSKLISIRAETLAEKPSFKNAFRAHRCIIPASGFYEWRKVSRGTKQPLYFHLKDKNVFGFAGLYDYWLNWETGKQIGTCTIITTQANEVLQPVRDRMPVILNSCDYDRWLDAKEKDTDKLQTLLTTYPAAKMKSYEVCKLVNKPSNDSAELIKNLF